MPKVLLLVTRHEFAMQLIEKLSAKFQVSVVPATKEVIDLLPPEIVDIQDFVICDIPDIQSVEDFSKVAEVISVFVQKKKPRIALYRANLPNMLEHRLLRYLLSFSNGYLFYDAFR